MIFLYFIKALIYISNIKIQVAIDIILKKYSGTSSQCYFWFMAKSDSVVNLTY